MERLSRHGQALRREAAELNVNEALGRHGPRITATLEQDPWFRALEGQIAELEKQHNDLHATMFAEYEKMGLGKPARQDRLPTLSPQALTRLRIRGGGWARPCGSSMPSTARPKRPTTPRRAYTSR